MRQMLMAILTAMVVAIPASGAEAQGWSEPGRGSPERRAMLDAFRPEAERLFGSPVEFIVHQLRLAGDVGFASVSAQRPGGGRIDIGSTPGWRSGYFMEDADWFGGQALLQRSGGRWVVVDGGFGATDVWWITPEYCARFRAVIADHCG